MELSQLETFLAVAEEKSFSRAAVRLHRTQPAISQVIRKLEAAVGETLLIGRRVMVLSRRRGNSCEIMRSGCSRCAARPQVRSTS